jgi:hypothetical protein
MATLETHPRHFLARAHRAMLLNGQQWLPHSSTWRHFVEVSDRTIRRAQQQGYLTSDTGIPMVTLKGYQEF